MVLAARGDPASVGTFEASGGRTGEVSVTRGGSSTDDDGTRRRRRPRRRPFVWPADGPKPGDPRSSGPRPRGTVRDGLWLALCGAIVVVTTLQLVRLVWTLASSGQVQVSGGGAFLGFLVTVVWLLTIFWLSAGAWRRSVWGCPFEHTEEAGSDRRCRRHALAPVTAPAVDQGSEAAHVDRPGDATDPAPGRP